MVLLMAKLPPHLEDKLFERTFWQREEVTLIRGSTVRSNIAYSVVDRENGIESRKAQLESIVTETLRDPTQPEGKVAVMCASVARSVAAACAQSLLLGRSAWASIDIPDVQFVVFVDEPRSTLDYAQTSGRGGRDGSPSRAIIIRGGLSSMTNWGNNIWMARSHNAVESPSTDIWIRIWGGSSVWRTSSHVTIVSSR
ncbi:hypothetical protein LTR56_026711 [Elasticomyces elasticus]|nr:hypothetical protein LTR56_026711 [Elasticomyces elasticus]KAK4902443.1 hypothetical protein LTR49_027039 [Elasticomyces elasticus]